VADPGELHQRGLALEDQVAQRAAGEVAGAHAVADVAAPDDRHVDLEVAGQGGRGSGSAASESNQ